MDFRKNSFVLYFLLFGFVQSKSTETQILLSELNSENHSLNLTVIENIYKASAHSQLPDDLPAGSSYEICDLENNKEICSSKGASCVPHPNIPFVFQCVCSDGSMVNPESGLNCAAIGICDVPGNKDICETHKAKCVPDPIDPKKFVCQCCNGLKKISNNQVFFDECPAKACGVPFNQENCRRRLGECLDDPTDVNKYQCKCKHGAPVDSQGNEFEICPETICDLSGNKNICEKKGGQCILDPADENNFRCQCANGVVVESASEETCPKTACNEKANRDLCVSKLGECVADTAEDSNFKCKCKINKSYILIDPTTIDKCPETICDVPKNKALCESKNAECIPGAKSLYKLSLQFHCRCANNDVVFVNTSFVCPKTLCDNPWNRKVCEARLGQCVPDGRFYRCACKGLNKTFVGGSYDPFSCQPNLCKENWQLDNCRQKGAPVCFLNEGDNRFHLCRCENGDVLKSTTSRTCSEPKACSVSSNVEKCTALRGKCEERENDDGSFICRCEHGAVKNVDPAGVISCSDAPHPCGDVENISVCSRKGGI